MAKRKFVASLVISNLVNVSLGYANEKILQQEEMSFEVCLKVIEMSADKLTIAPEIVDVSDTMRIASFKLLDGVLVITCDEEQGLMTVSSN